MTAIHGKDRRARVAAKSSPSGQRRGRARKGQISAEPWPPTGSSARQYKSSRSSESRGNGKTASCAIDGDPGTWWHSQFNPTLAKHPHEIVIDLESTGSRPAHMAQPDGGWNGVDKFTPHVGTTRNCSVAASQSASRRSKAQDAMQGQIASIRHAQGPSEVVGGPGARSPSLACWGSNARRMPHRPSRLCGAVYQGHGGLVHVSGPSTFVTSTALRPVTSNSQMRWSPGVR